MEVLKCKLCIGVGKKDKKHNRYPSLSENGQSLNGNKYNVYKQKPVYNVYSVNQNNIRISLANYESRRHQAAAVTRYNREQNMNLNSPVEKRLDKQHKLMDTVAEVSDSSESEEAIFFQDAEEVEEHSFQEKLGNYRAGLKCVMTDQLIRS